MTTIIKKRFVMRLLLCSSIPNPSKQLGASKLILELAEALQSLGHSCDIFPCKPLAKGVDYTEAILNAIKQKDGNYDIIELPDSITQLPPSSKHHRYIIRSILLEYHFTKGSFPIRPLSWKAHIKSIALTLLNRQHINYPTPSRLHFLDSLFASAHAINFANSMDAKAIRKRGINKVPILTIPYGIADENRKYFEQISTDIPPTPKIAFVGTFDFRKGCLDLIQIVKCLSDTYPDLQFKFLGTKGMLQTTQEVLNCFPRKYHKRLEIIPTYQPNKLPSLLQDCSLGIFPSYIEAFGIGIIEMLAAALPVIAYDAPGPCDILPTNQRIPIGDVGAMCKQIKLLLNNPQELQQQRIAARKCSDKYNWETIAKRTIDAYQNLVSA